MKIAATCLENIPLCGDDSLDEDAEEEEERLVHGGEVDPDVEGEEEHELHEEAGVDQDVGHAGADPDGSDVKRSIGSTTSCTITEKAPTRAFSWLKAPTSAFTFKTLLRHYAKRALTPRSLNVKLGPQRNYHEGRAAI